MKMPESSLLGTERSSIQHIHARKVCLNTLCLPFLSHSFSLMSSSSLPFLTSPNQLFLWCFNFPLKFKCKIIQHLCYLSFILFKYEVKVLTIRQDQPHSWDPEFQALVFFFFFCMFTVFISWGSSVFCTIKCQVTTQHFWSYVHRSQELRCKFT